MNKDEILDNYIKAKLTPSDINEHIETLFNLAKEVEHITEMGVRNVVSTWAFMLRNPKKLIGIDIHVNENVEAAKLLYPNWEFIQADTLKIKIKKTDLLFIDTLHIYTQLRHELAIHAMNVKKYIVLHDTTTYGHTDEPTDWQTPEIMENYKLDNKRGLKPAIKEFLAANEDWFIFKEYTNNNGLTILKRK